MKIFPPVDDHDEIQQALRTGALACLVLSAMLAVGGAYLIFGGRLKVAGSADLTGSWIELGGVAIELAVVLWCAWRFHHDKGRFLGIVVFVLFALEMVNKYMTVSPSIFWIFIHLGIGLSLINGIRGAWAAHRLPAEVEIANVFD